MSYKRFSELKISLFVFYCDNCKKCAIILWFYTKTKFF